MGIRLLHLSDIHFSTKPGDEQIVHEDVRTQLLNDLRTEVSDWLPVNAVLVAGDVAFSGKRAEYEVAAAWLEEVTTICGCPATAVLPVPGNHDVDRDRILPATKMIHSRLRSCSLPEASTELVQLSDSGDRCLIEKLSDYQAFASSYGCPFASHAKPYWNRSFPVSDGKALSFVGLTTVQVSDSQDAKGALLLGRNQYVVNRTAATEIVAVMHHPFEWLKDHREASQYLSSRARVLIFGHEHVQDIHKITDGNKEERLIIGSGAVTPERASDPFIYRYNVIDLSIEEKRGRPCLAVTVVPRIWVPERTKFDADSARLSGRSSMRFSLACPQFGLTASAPTSASDANPNDDEAISRLRYLFWRHLTWQDRLKVVVQAGLLPEGPQVASPQLESLAFEKAAKDAKLDLLWEHTMQAIPIDKREANPFGERKN